MSTRRIIQLAITAIAVFGAATGYSTAAIASTSATGQPAAAAAVAPSFPSTSDRCVNQNHTKECWALTLASGTFFLRSGGTESIGVNDLVLIQCWYTDSSGTEDHIIAEDAGGDTEIGHVHDSIVDLNNHNPGMLQFPPNIPGC
jgi:hypothetical protein